MDHLSEAELLERVATAKAQVPVGSKWQHYKGGTYVVTDVVIIELTSEVGIVYLSLDHPSVKFLRPLVAWQEVVTWECEEAFRLRLLGS